MIPTYKIVQCTSAKVIMIMTSTDKVDFLGQEKAAG